MPLTCSILLSAQKNESEDLCTQKDRCNSATHPTRSTALLGAAGDLLEDMRHGMLKKMDNLLKYTKLQPKVFYYRKSGALFPEYCCGASNLKSYFVWNLSYIEWKQYENKFHVPAHLKNSMEAIVYQSHMYRRLKAKKGRLAPVISCV